MNELASLLVLLRGTDFFTFLKGEFEEKELPDGTVFEWKPTSDFPDLV